MSVEKTHTPRGTRPAPLPSHRPSLSPPPQAKAGKVGHTMPPLPQARFLHTVNPNGKALGPGKPSTESTAGGSPSCPSWWATTRAACAPGSRNVYFASAGLQGNYREPNPQPRKSDFIRTPKGDTSGPWADHRPHGGEFHTVASGDITAACA